jgi:hypothetical protein
MGRRLLYIRDLQQNPFTCWNVCAFQVVPCRNYLAGKHWSPGLLAMGLKRKHRGSMPHPNQSGSPGFAS